MHPPSIWAVMPVKHLSQAKSRLAAALGPQRADFAKALLRHMLAALGEAEIFARILVVTPDDTIAGLAAAAGAIVVTDSGLSLNDACTLGLAAAQAGGADITVLIPADLALLGAEDMRALLAAYLAAETRLGLVRCKDGDGTNMVFCRRGTAFTPQFGPESFARHAALAPYRELINANAAFDIDTAADFARLAARTLAPGDPIAHFFEQRINSSGPLTQ